MTSLLKYNHRSVTKSAGLWGVVKVFPEVGDVKEGKNYLTLTEKEQSRKKQGPNDFVKVLHSYNVASFALINDNVADFEKRERWGSEV